jgi:tRNA A-37 threonylcarbamoyl transferase component Bud32/predicted hydrocarbon binding protein
VHGLIFFFIRKFAEASPAGLAATAGPGSGQTALLQRAGRYLPSGTYPDGDAVTLLQTVADTRGQPLADTVAEFGEFLAPHLLKVAGPLVNPAWRTLDLVEHTEELIHAMVRVERPGAEPPVLEVVRIEPTELHLVYSSRRRLCLLAAGLIRGLARHFGEAVEIEEPGCMLRGDPFCSFVIRGCGRETHASASPASETVVLPVNRAPQAVDRLGMPPEFDGADDNPLPALIGGYRILEPIGSGAMGRVYLAHDDRLDRRVAIKVMNPNRARDPDARRRFLREGRAAAVVEHPHLLTIHAVGEHEGLPYIVMQRLEGQTLGAHRAACGTLPVAEALRIGREIAEGLAAAHARGLVHRDIKPENVFLEGPHRSVRIIDFGLARAAADGSAKLTVEGAVVGTPAYMPPERIGEESLDAQSDLFGLGVMLYELLAGRLPFEGLSMVAMLASIAKGTPVPLADAAPRTPPEVCNLVMRLMAHRKEDRPATAAAVAAELGRLERKFADRA